MINSNNIFNTFSPVQVWLTKHSRMMWRPSSRSGISSTSSPWVTRTPLPSDSAVTPGKEFHPSKSYVSQLILTMYVNQFVLGCVWYLTWLYKHVLGCAQQDYALFNHLYIAGVYIWLCVYILQLFASWLGVHINYKYIQFANFC